METCTKETGRMTSFMVGVSSPTTKTITYSTEYGKKDSLARECSKQIAMRANGRMEGVAAESTLPKMDLSIQASGGTIKEMGTASTNIQIPMCMKENLKMA